MSKHICPHSQPYTDLLSHFTPFLHIRVDTRLRYTLTWRGRYFCAAHPQTCRPMVLALQVSGRIYRSRYYISPLTMRPAAHHETCRPCMALGASWGMSIRIYRSAHPPLSLKCLGDHVQAP